MGSEVFHEASSLSIMDNQEGTHASLLLASASPSFRGWCRGEDVTAGDPWALTGLPTPTEHCLHQIHSLQRCHMLLLVRQSSLGQPPRKVTTAVNSRNFQSLPLMRINIAETSLLLLQTKPGHPWPAGLWSKSLPVK